MSKPNIDDMHRQYKLLERQYSDQCKFCAELAEQLNGAQKYANSLLAELNEKGEELIKAMVAEG